MARGIGQAKGATASIGSSTIYRALLHVERLLAHRAIASLIAIWFGVMLLASLGMYAVGYGDIAPQTTEGRLAAVVLMVLGISLFGIITATATSVLTTGQGDGADAGSLAEVRQLARLYREEVITREQFAEQAGRLLLIGPEETTS